MGRKKNVIAPEAQGMELVANDQHQQQLTAVRAFELYGFKDIQNYDLFIYKQKIGLFLHLADRSIMEAGKGLLVIKAQEPHGVFIKTLEDIGIPERTARRYMSIARRFGKTANLAVLPASKLEALCELDDPTLEKLDTGEDILGLTLKGIDAMPTSEVRKKAKELESKLDSAKKQHAKDIKEMSAEIEKLRLEVSGLEPPTKEKIAQAYLDDFDKKYDSAIANAECAIDQCRILILDAQKIKGITFEQLNNWMIKNDENIEELKTTIDELWETIDDIHADKGNEEEEE